MSEEQYQEQIPEEESKKPSRKRLVIYGVVGAVLVCILCSVAYNIFLPGDDGEEVAGVTSAPAEAVIEELPPDETPLPTDTPEPTNTPEPTATPTEEPTPMPDPIILTGSGDSVVDFENPFEISSIAHISGNAASSYFGVTSYDDGGEDVNLLVNTTDPYSGTVLLDFGLTHTTRFEVTAVGEWTIDVNSSLTARELEVPGTIEGEGDDVFILRGSTPDLANIKGNEQAHYFGVFAYNNIFPDLIVNTTDPYEGTVPIPNDTILITVTAVGPWSIEVTAK